MRLHHIQLTHPASAEDEARRFYRGVLGLKEIAKPSELEGRGGVWFQVGDAQLHFGVEEGGLESRRHVALETADLDAVRARLEAAGTPLEAAIPLHGMARFYCRNPFGNRLELLSRES